MIFNSPANVIGQARWCQAPNLIRRLTRRRLLRLVMLFVLFVVHRWAVNPLDQAALRGVKANDP